MTPKPKYIMVIVEQVKNHRLNIWNLFSKNILQIVQISLLCSIKTVSFTVILKFEICFENITTKPAVLMQMLQTRMIQLRELIVQFQIVFVYCLLVPVYPFTKVSVHVLLQFSLPNHCK